MKKENDAKKMNKIICFTFSLVSVGILLFLLSIKMDFVFISNDDIYIRAILSGDITGTPDAHAIYILYPLAWIISSFYKLFTNMNWYGIFTIGMHSLCWVLILYRMSLLGKTKWKQVCIFSITFFLLIFLDLQHLIFSQYTALAGIIGCTAIFWFVTIKKIDKWQAYIPVMVLLSISFLIRSKAALMCIPFLVCFGIYKLLEVYFERKDKIKAIYIFKIYSILFVFTGLILGGLFSLHMVAYQTDEWKEFNEYNKYRTEVYDFYSYPSYEENTDFYQSLGILKEEMYLIQSGNLGMDENITIEKMQAIFEKSKEIYKWNQQFYSVPRKILFTYLDSFKDTTRGSIVLLMLYGGAFFLVFMERKNYLWISFASIFIMRSLIRCYLLYRGRFPERVSYPLTIAEIIILLGIIMHVVCKNKKQENLKHENVIGFRIGMFVLSTFMLLLILDVYKENLDRCMAIQSEESWVENIFPYLEQNMENNYLLEVQSTATLKAPVFGEQIKMPENAIYLGGWLQKSPLIKQQYENRFGDVIEDEVLDKNKMYFLQKSTLSITWIEEYFRTKNSSIEAKEIDHIELYGNKIYSIIQLK